MQRIALERFAKGQIVMIDNDHPSSESTRMLVTQALRLYPTKSLLPFLDDSDAIVRTAAARQLQVRGEHETLEFLVLHLQDARTQYREIVAFTLSQFGTPNYPYRAKLIPALVSLASDVAFEVRSAAVAGLGHLHAEEAIDTVVAASTDSEPDVRASAAASLGQMAPSPLVIATLERLLQDEDEDVREWANLGRELISDQSANQEGQ